MIKKVIFSLILAFVFSLSALAQTRFSVCPEIKVSGGGVVRIGEPMSFTTKITGGMAKESTEYEWTVSAGTISSGQGTYSITVDTATLANGTEITAEVKIKGLFDDCRNTASETGSVIPHCILPILADEFGRLTNNEIKAYIQATYVRLSTEPESRGYIINYGTDKEIAERERQIRRAVNLLKLDANRLTIVRGGENPNGAGIWTKIYIVPPDVDYPQP